MSKLRRYPIEGRPVFVTSVTHLRKRILEEHANLLLQVFRRYEVKYGFHVPVWVIMPDHFHAIIEGDDVDISGIMRRIKASFTTKYKNLTQTQHCDSKLWQHRFWDHIIRSQEDLNHHIDYIHYNPVKHGLVESPFAYRHSSLHSFAQRRYYQPDWGAVSSLQGDFGE